jgi:hypothetical protein
MDEHLGHANASFPQSAGKRGADAPLNPDCRPLAAHIWAKEEHGVYIEPQCNERLFEVEKFKGAIWDPACGIGRVAEAARRAGYRTIATDMIDRGYPRLDACIDFLCCESPRTQNIVCNPPFDICDQFVRRALHLASGKVAMIWLARRLNAARWLANTPLACIYLLTPRPSMPPGHVIAREARRRNSGFLLAGLFPQAQGTANAALALP